MRCLLFLSLTLSISPLTAKDLKVISWNVLYGFNKRTEVATGQEWLRKQRPDIVALQELNGFTEDTLRETASAWGHSYSAILKTDGFPVGLTSKTPIEVIRKIRDGLWHGCLHARTNGTDFMVIHLSPGDRAMRGREMTLLTPVVEALLHEKRRVFVLGDFNDRSPRDLEYINQQPLLMENAKPGNLFNGSYDSAVVGGFLNAGLRDASAPLPANFSVPSQIKPHANTAAKQAKVMQRIDFILTDPVTADEVLSAYTAHDEILNRVSDHYPIIHISDRAE